MSDPLLHDKLRLLMSSGQGSPEADKLLNECMEDGGECMKCSEICCPHGEPLHFHHDGCPACHGSPVHDRDNEDFETF